MQFWIMPAEFTDSFYGRGIRLQSFSNRPVRRLTYLSAACAIHIIGETLIRARTLTSISIINQEQNRPMSLFLKKCVLMFHPASHALRKRHTPALTMASHLASCSVIFHMLTLRDSWQLWQNINYCHPSMFQTTGKLISACLSHFHVFFFNSFSIQGAGTTLLTKQCTLFMSCRFSFLTCSFQQQPGFGDSQRD